MTFLQQIRRLVRRGYEKWRWPKPLWRVRGYAKLDVAGQTFTFCDAGRSPQHGWAGRIHRGNWEAEVIALFAQVLRPGDIVLDIGAYVGPYALLASRLVTPAGRVYAFEPDPIARATLKRNVHANQARNVDVMPYAVGANDGWGSFAYGVPGDSATRIMAAPSTDVERVPIVSLTTFCRRWAVRPDVIKVDVEGAEAEVFESHSLSLVGQARAVFVEIHESELRARGTSGDVLVDRLVDQGGHLIEIADRGRGSRNVAVLREDMRPETPVTL
jgi:FkbM family methyltransferase